MTTGELIDRTLAELHSLPSDASDKAEVGILRAAFEEVREEEREALDRTYAALVRCEADLDRERARADRLAAALKEIAEHEHQSDIGQHRKSMTLSNHDWDDGYDSGISTGHRCAAAIARKALEDGK